MTESDARTRGYVSVTRPYKPSEKPLMESAIRQFSGVSIVLVETGSGTEIWRLAHELRLDPGEPISAAEAKRAEHFGRGPRRR